MLREDQENDNRNTISRPIYWKKWQGAITHNINEKGTKKYINTSKHIIIKLQNEHEIWQVSTSFLMSKYLQSWSVATATD